MNTDLKFHRGVKRKLEQANLNNNNLVATGDPTIVVKKVNLSYHHNHDRTGSTTTSTTIGIASSPSSTLSPATNGSLDAKVSSSASSSSSPLSPSPSPSPASRESYSTTCSSSLNPSSINVAINEEYLSPSNIRQIVFNMSMCKLSRFRQTPDPSLVRSVLICNTLKRLEQELDREGIRINFGPNGVSFISSSSSSSPTISSPVTSNLSLNGSLSSSPLPTDELTKAFAVDGNSPPSGRLTPFPTRDDDDSDNSDDSVDCNALNDSAFDMSSGSSDNIDSSSSTNATNSDESDSGLWSPDPQKQRIITSQMISSWSSSSTSSIEMSFDESEDVSSDDSSSRESNGKTFSSVPRHDSRPSPILSLHELQPPPHLQQHQSPRQQLSPMVESSSVTNAEKEDAEIAVKNVLRLSTTSNNNNNNSEEMFGDIDLSLYDFDLLSPITTPNVKMLTPISAEELLRSIGLNGDCGGDARIAQQTSNSDSSPFETSSSSTSSFVELNPSTLLNTTIMEDFVPSSSTDESSSSSPTSTTMLISSTSITILSTTTSYQQQPEVPKVSSMSATCSSFVSINNDNHNVPPSSSSTISTSTPVMSQSSPLPLTTTSTSSTSCATQSQSSSSNSVVFSKIFISKKDSIQYLDDIAAAIS